MLDLPSTVPATAVTTVSVTAGKGPDQVRVPWTPGQVASLNAYQMVGVFRPYTCRNRGDADHPDIPPYDRGTLVASTAGWQCPIRGCGYTQNWAFRWTADGSWAQHRFTGDAR